jgi:uncharacterized membrane protein YgcG
MPNDNTAAIILGVIAAIIVVGYTIYRAFTSARELARVRARAEDEAWQRHIGLPPLTTRRAKYVGAVKDGNYYSNPDKRPRKIANPMNSSAVDGYNAAMPDTFDLGGGSGFNRSFSSPGSNDVFGGGGGSFGGGGASDSWSSSSDSCSSDSGDGGSDGGGGGDCGGSSD